VREVVVASSNKAYGTALNLPYVETDPLNGVFPLDVSKSCADLICRMYAITYGVPVCTTRCANLFGGGDLNFNRVIPGVIRATQRGERFVVRSNGRFTRDFLYVRDAARAHVMVAEAMAANPTLRGTAFNFGLEVRLTVLQLVEQVLGLMRRPDLAPIVQDIAADEVREQQLSAEKARRLLGWIPEYTLEQGLRETIDWYDNLPDQSRSRRTAPLPPALADLKIPSGGTQH
jgi:CDP-glucose 4,6-dehydratase